MVEIKGERFAVTGGAGFIGSHIVEELIKQGKSVVVVDDFSNGTRRNLAEWWDPRLGEIKELDVGSECLVIDGCDVVFHEACSKCTVCRSNPAKDLVTNAMGSFNVFDAARKAGAKVVHASTGSVYGRETRFGQQTETGHFAPTSFYGVSKLAGEQYLRAFKEYYGLIFVGLRYFHVYGPRQDAGPNGGVVAIFITKMLKGEPITIFGAGNQTRSFTYVKDVVKANLIAANSENMEGQYFNVASGVSVSINKLIDCLEDLLGVEAERHYVDPKPGDIWTFDVCNDKIAAHGMDSWVAFEEGLKETIDYYRGVNATVR